jgi:hypothetical protein
VACIRVALHHHMRHRTSLTSILFCSAKINTLQAHALDRTFLSPLPSTSPFSLSLTSLLASLSSFTLSLLPLALFPPI